MAGRPITEWDPAWIAQRGDVAPSGVTEVGTLELALDEFPPVHRQVVEHIVFGKLNQSETARLVGVSRQRVNAVWAEAMTMLRDVADG